MEENAQDEKQRLVKLYDELTDARLQEIADEAPGLTEAARSALADVIARRGLGIRLADSIPFDEVEWQELVTIRRFRDLPEALVAKGALEAAGIESSLADENMVRMQWFISTGIGGIRLQVRKEDVDEALSVLGEPVPDTFDVEGVGAFEQPKCPRCGSVDVTHQEGMDKRIALPALWALGVPVPVSRDNWVCESCGARWQEIPDEGPTDASGSAT
jgi:hypothetical protein